MKTKIVITGKIILAIAVLLVSSELYAQREHAMRNSHKPGCDSTISHMQGIPDLTADQKEKISSLRTAHLKEMNAMRNDLDIKQAELKKYRTADKPDMNLVNKTIDEIGEIKTDMQKKQVSHEMSVRSLLTDEQKVFFDSRSKRRHEQCEMGEHGRMRHNPGVGPKRTHE